MGIVNRPRKLHTTHPESVSNSYVGGTGRAWIDCATRKATWQFSDFASTQRMSYGSHKRSVASIVDMENPDVSFKDDMQKWLEAVPVPGASGASLDQSRTWLKDRRRERARKSVRRRISKTLHHLWDIEKRLISQGLASTRIHTSLTKIVGDLNSFLDDYNRQTSG